MPARPSSDKHFKQKKPAHPVNHKAERDRSPPASSLSTLGLDTAQSRTPLQGRTESMIRSGGKEGVQAAYIEEENKKIYPSHFQAFKSTRPTHVRKGMHARPGPSTFKPRRAEEEEREKEKGQHLNNLFQLMSPPRSCNLAPPSTLRLRMTLTNGLHCIKTRL